MSKPCKKISFLTAMLIFSSALCGCFEFSGADKKFDASDALLRLHIRAHSNDVSDQTVKLAVRDAVNEYLAKELLGVEDVVTAKNEVIRRIARICSLADGVLKRGGFAYKSAARIDNEYFPIRVYDNVTVNAGYYDALIIDLGSGAGDNWWCVIYPPLCYLEAESDRDVTYKSFIGEWWSGKK